MFGTNALPLPSPSTFAHEHRPLRLTSEASRSHPAGPCHFILLHPTHQNQRCSCQSYHHNRSAPGNICDCGHQACYHLHHAPTQDTPRPHEAISLSTEHGLLDRVRRLEETIQHEREARENAMLREKQLWERETRILREALAPFYKSEQDMRRKFIEIEDRIEGNYDEQVRLRDRVVSLDDANMQVEKRVEELEGRSKRRRISRQIGGEEAMPNGHVADIRRLPNNLDDRSVHSSSSRALSPNSNFTAGHDPEEPRSSGNLNLLEMPRPTTHPPPLLIRRRTPQDQEEPRSSGFLALDLAERLGNRKSDSSQDRDASETPSQGLAREQDTPPDYAQSDPDRPMERRSPTFARPPPPPPPPPSTNRVHRNGMIILPSEMSPRKRKHPAEHMALDVLADVSVASPLIH